MWSSTSGTGVTVICVSPWCVCPRTHITSDMCFPCRKTQNTEARYPITTSKTKWRSGVWKFLVCLSFTICKKSNTNKSRRSQSSFFVLGALATSSLASRDSLSATSSRSLGIRSRLVTITVSFGGKHISLKGLRQWCVFPLIRILLNYIH